MLFRVRTSRVLHVTNEDQEIRQESHMPAPTPGLACRCTIGHMRLLYVCVAAGPAACSRGAWGLTHVTLEVSITMSSHSASAQTISRAEIGRVRILNICDKYYTMTHTVKILFSVRARSAGPLSKNTLECDADRLQRPSTVETSRVEDNLVNTFANLIGHASSKAARKR